MTKAKELEKIKVSLISLLTAKRESIGEVQKRTGKPYPEFASTTEAEHTRWHNKYIRVPPLSAAELEDKTAITGKLRLYFPRQALELIAMSKMLLEKGELDKAINLVELSDSFMNIYFLAVEGGMSLAEARSAIGKLAVFSKLKNDPKQVAKAFVMDCWQTWQEEPDRYKSKAAFARDMLQQEQCKSLISQVKITDWCREWEKSHPAGRMAIMPK